MVRVLITGIGGFTGNYLRSELENSGHEVFGLIRAGGIPSPRVFACDLLDSEALTAIVTKVKPDAVAHLAAVSFVGHHDFEQIYATNILGTRNLLSALVEAAPGVRMVLLPSSANVYGNSTAGVIHENQIPCPTNDYAVSKLAMEHMAACWAPRLPITVVRPFNYTGVGQTQAFLIPKIVAHIRRKAGVIDLGNLDVERDFSDVRFVVRVYRHLLELSAPINAISGPMNICSGSGVTLRRLVEIASDIGGHPLTVRVNPQYIRINEVRKLVGSRALLEQALGPIPPVPLRDTLAWMIESSSGP